MPSHASGFSRLSRKTRVQHLPSLHGLRALSESCIKPGEWHSHTTSESAIRSVRATGGTNIRLPTDSLDTWKSGREVLCCVSLQTCKFLHLETSPCAPSEWRYLAMPTNLKATMPRLSNLLTTPFTRRAPQQFLSRSMCIPLTSAADSHRLGCALYFCP